MTLSDECLLVSLILGLYLVDSANLLHLNEGVLVAGRSKWSVFLGMEKLQLRGRYVYVPSLLSLHKPAFRLAWDIEASPPRGTDPNWTRRREQLNDFAPFVYASAIVLLGLLPLTVTLRLGDEILLLVLLLLYANLLACVTLIWIVRIPLQVAVFRAFTLSVECLICPPNALNIVRKLSLESPPEADLVNAASALLTPEDWSQLRARLLYRLDEVILGEELGSERFKRLEKRRWSVAGMGGGR